MSRRLLLCIGMLFALPAFAEDEAEAPTPPPIREIVEAGNYLFQRNFEDQDPRALADLYTEDGVVIAPGAAPLSGRDAIEAFWKTQMQALARVQLTTTGVESDGDLAVEHGNAVLFGHDGSEIGIQYVVVWKRVGRRWHLHRDIWNAAPAPGADAASAEADATPAGADAPAADATPAGVEAPAEEATPESPDPESLPVEPESVLQ